LCDAFKRKTSEKLSLGNFTITLLLVGRKSR
jgi:hypothetical protein